MESTHLRYETLTLSLDQHNELEISTYPSDFPDKISSTPYAHQELRSPEHLYFQVFIKDKAKDFGQNDYVKSIFIESFSVQINDQPPVQLLAGYENNFWMQGNPRYQPTDLPPLQYIPNGVARIEIAFTLNGKRYQFAETLAAEESTEVLPLILRSR